MADDTIPVAAGKPLAITEDDRAALKGFNAQRQLLAQAVHALNAEQGAYLGRLAVRLGIAPEEIAKYQINLDTLTLVQAPKPGAAS